MDFRILLGFLPFSVCAGFLLHWFLIRKISQPKSRLEQSRESYLTLSFQLLLFSIFLWALGLDVGIWVFFAMLFSFLGDFFNLEFPLAKKIYPDPLQGGIYSFFIAQIFYLIAIVKTIPLDSLFPTTFHVLLVVGLVVFPAILFPFRIYNPNRDKKILYSALVYGFLLCFVVGLMVNSALVYGGRFWFLAVGGGFFLLSDAVMGETTVHGGRHPVWEFQVPWFTYLIAQGLILYSFGYSLVFPN